MTQEIIDTGSVPNDGSGDPLREAFNKINNNFANLFSLTGANTQLVELVNPFDANAEPVTGNTNTLNIGNVYITNTFDSTNSLVVTPKKTLTAPTPPTLSTGPYGSQEYIALHRQQRLKARVEIGIGHRQKHGHGGLLLHSRPR